MKSLPVLVVFSAIFLAQLSFAGSAEDAFDYYRKMPNPVHTGNPDEQGSLILRKSVFNNNISYSTESDQDQHVQLMFVASPEETLRKFLCDLWNESSRKNLKECLNEPSEKFFGVSKEVVELFFRTHLPENLTGQFSFKHVNDEVLSVRVFRAKSEAAEMPHDVRPDLFDLVFEKQGSSFAELFAIDVPVLTNRDDGNCRCLCRIF